MVANAHYIHDRQRSNYRHWSSLQSHSLLCIQIHFTQFEVDLGSIYKVYCRGQHLFIIYKSPNVL